MNESAAPAPGLDPGYLDGEPTGTIVDEQNPWPGLASFTEGMARFFFGREAEAAELFGLIRRETLAILFGVSGLGKSSLLRAGVFPRLRQANHLPVYIRLSHLADGPSPVAQVLAALREQCAMAGVEAPAPGEGETLWEYFRREGNDFWSPEQALVTPVLAFDQFEEIFTIGAETPAHRRRSLELIEALACLIENRPPAEVRARFEADPGLAGQFDAHKRNCKVLLALRSDYLSVLDSAVVRNVMPSVAHHRYELRKMNGLQALEVVTRPGPGLVDPEAAIGIVRYVAGAEQHGGDNGEHALDGACLEDLRVEPALLSVFCHILNRKRFERSEERISTMLFSGTKDEILPGYYRETIARYPKDVQRFVEEGLLTVDGRRNSLDEANALALPGITTEVLGRLINDQLVRLEYASGWPRVELTHDVLTGVVKESFDERKKREDAADAHRREQQTQAELAVRTRQLEEREHELRARKRMIRLLQALCVFAIVLFGLAVWSWRNAVASRRVAKLKQSEAEAAARETEHQLIDSLKDSGRASLLEGRSDIALTYLTEAWRRLALLGERKDATTELLLGQAAAPHLALTTELRGHTGPVLAAQWSPDESVVLTASDDKSARIWRAADGHLLASCDGHSEAVTSAAFSPDGRRIATGGADQALFIWNAADGRRLLGPLPSPPQHSEMPSDPSVPFPGPAETAHSGTINHIAFAPKAPLLATAGADGRVLVWNVETGACVHSLEAHRGPVQMVQFSADGASLVSAGGDGAARIWKVETGELARTLGGDGGHKEIIQSAQWSPAPGPPRVLTAGADGRAILWDAETGDAIFSCNTKSVRGEGTLVTGAAFSQAGALFVTANSAGAVQVWDAATGQLLADFVDKEELAPAAVNALALDRQGRLAATASDNGVVKLWDARSGNLLLRLQHGGSLTAVAFNREGTRLISSSRDGTVRVWDLPQSRAVRTLNLHAGALEVAALSPDGARIVTASRDGTARLWDTATGQPVGEPLRHGEQWVLDTVFDFKGERLLTLSAREVKLWHADGKPLTDAAGTPIVWPALPGAKWSRALFADDGGSVLLARFDGHWEKRETFTGKQIAASKEPLERLDSFVTVPDGTYCVGAGGGTAALWDLRTGERRMLDAATNIHCVAVGPQGFALGGLDGSVRVVAQTLDALRGAGWTELDAHRSRVLALTFAQTSPLLASAAGDGAVHVHDLQQGRMVASVGGEHGPIRQIAFDPHGAFLATGSEAGAVRLWEPRTGREVAAFEGHSAPIVSLAFDSAGPRLVSASRDGTAKIWTLAPLPEATDLAQLAAIVHSRVPFHLEEGRLFPGALCRVNMAFDRSGRPLLTGLDDKTLRTAGSRLEEARRDALNGRRDSALTHLLSSGMQDIAQLPAARFLQRYASSRPEPVAEGGAEIGSEIAALGHTPDGWRAVRIDKEEIQWVDAAQGKPVRSIPLGGGYAGGKLPAPARCAVLVHVDRKLPQASDDSPGAATPKPPASDAAETALLAEMRIQIAELLTPALHALPGLEPQPLEDQSQADTLAAARALRAQAVLVVEVTLPPDQPPSEEDPLLPSSASLAVTLRDSSGAEIWTWSEKLHRRGKQWVVEGDKAPGEDENPVALADALCAGLLATRVNDPVTATADASLILVTHYDGTCHLHGEAGLPIRLPAALQGSPVLLAQAREGARIAVADKYEVAVIERASGAEVWRGTGGQRDRLTCVAFDPQGRHLLTATADGLAKIWTLDAAKDAPPVVLAGHRGAIGAAVFSTDGRRIVTGGEDGVTRAWESASGQLIGAMEDSPAPLLATAFFQGDALIVAAAQDGSVRCWDMATNRLLSRWQASAAPLRRAALSPDAHLLAILDEEGRCRVVEVPGTTPTSLSQRTPAATPAP